jgi:hypothetical protein
VSWIGGKQKSEDLATVRPERERVERKERDERKEKEEEKREEEEEK